MRRMWIMAQQPNLARRQHAGDANRVADDQGRREGFLLAFHLGNCGGGVTDVYHRWRVDLLVASELEQKFDARVCHPGIEDALFLQQLAEALGIDLDLGDLLTVHLNAHRVHRVDLPGMSLGKHVTAESHEVVRQFAVLLGQGMIEQSILLDLLPAVEPVVYGSNDLVQKGSYLG